MPKTHSLIPRNSQIREALEFYIIPLKLAYGIKAEVWYDKGEHAMIMIAEKEDAFTLDSDGYIWWGYTPLIHVYPLTGKVALVHIERGETYKATVHSIEELKLHLTRWWEIP